MAGKADGKPSSAIEYKMSPDVFEAMRKKFGHHSDSTWMIAVGRIRCRASSTHGARSRGK